MLPGVIVVPGTPGTVPVGSDGTVTMGSGDGDPGLATTIEMLASAGDIDCAWTAMVTVSCCPGFADLAIRSLMMRPNAVLGGIDPIEQEPPRTAGQFVKLGDKMDWLLRSTVAVTESALILLDTQIS